MRSFAESSDLLFGIYGQNDADFFGDVLIEEEETQKQKEEWPCEMKYQFMLHAVEDRLDEILAEGKWKKSGVTGVDACWIGYVCNIGNFNAYGYLTTNSKYITIIEDGMAPDNMELQKSRDNELKNMIVSSSIILCLFLQHVSLSNVLIENTIIIRCIYTFPFK